MSSKKQLTTRTANPGPGSVEISRPATKADTDGKRHKAAVCFGDVERQIDKYMIIDIVQMMQNDYAKKYAAADCDRPWVSWTSCDTNR